MAIPEATAKGYAIANDGDYVDLAYPDSKTRRGRVGKQCAQTLLCNDNNGVVVSGTYTNDSKKFHREPLKNLSRTLKANNHDAGVIENGYRIRKLTPLECWRLMGFTDEDFYKAQAVNSNSQLYKQAGNSIVKQVLMAIFAQMILDDYEFKKNN